MLMKLEGKKKRKKALAQIETLVTLNHLAFRRSFLPRKLLNRYRTLDTLCAPTPIQNKTIT